MDTSAVAHERRSSQQVTHLPRVGSFIYSGIDTRQKMPMAFSVSFEGHRQSGVKNY